MIKQWSLIIVGVLFMAAASTAAAEQKVIMEIEGMTCTLCAVAVEKSLSRVQGVEGVRVSHKERKAQLTADESVTDATLVEAVRKAGPYKGKVATRTPVH